ncbi:MULTISPECIES: encapsulin-associated ferritin-like protein [Polyangium]|uniref:Ferritin n=2 Tax=Polyangium TaxID=55 RepID=A0A4U1JKA0_9BACT|nr:MULTISPECIES: ferritin-like domain-containing protein [Polyangium]MDI1431954.1 ferritin-like domain-containing protein [Polyangium sorediatum]TKD13201.1 ferritin [Polyangium fumosum]
MGSETYHEPYDVLSPAARDMHRALWSLIEELEAIDWYAQRAEVTNDAELKAVLLHNRAEEIEHAMMNLEWIRRQDPLFDKNIRTYLLKDVPITEIEASEERKQAGEAQGARAGASPPPAPSPPRAGAGRGLGIASLRRR